VLPVLQALVGIDPDCHPYRAELGITLADLGDHPAALAALDDAIARHNLSTVWKTCPEATWRWWAQSDPGSRRFGGRQSFWSSHPPLRLPTRCTGSTEQQRRGRPLPARHQLGPARSMPASAELRHPLAGRQIMLKDQLDQAGQRWQRRGERTTIIVDGLDRIPREQNPQRSLLNELPGSGGVPDGVFVILGTQTTTVLPRPVEAALQADDRTIDVAPLPTSVLLQLIDTASGFPRAEHGAAPTATRRIITGTRPR
jgi:hypothetical protein